MTHISIQFLDKDAAAVRFSFAPQMCVFLKNQMNKKNATKTDGGQRTMDDICMAGALKFRHWR